jgi:hypothetical protein
MQYKLKIKLVKSKESRETFKSKKLFKCELLINNVLRQVKKVFMVKNKKCNFDFLFQSFNIP